MMNPQPKRRLIEQAASDLTKELTDRGKLVEAGFDIFAYCAIPKEAPPTQLSEMRLAYMAGAEHVFWSIATEIEIRSVAFGGENEPYMRQAKEALAIAEKLPVLLELAKRADMAILGIEAARAACKEISGGNCAFIDDDVAKTLYEQRNRAEAAERERDKLKEKLSWALKEYEAADNETKRLRTRVEKLERIDAEAATHVESIICMKSKRFTGGPPYVGWKGLGLALSEDYAELKALRTELAKAREALKPFAAVAELAGVNRLADHATVDSPIELGAFRRARAALIRMEE